MLHYLSAMLLILALLLGWIAVQHLARAVAARYPQLGPYREDGACRAGGGCGNCPGEHCETRDSAPPSTPAS